MSALARMLEKQDGTSGTGRGGTSTSTSSNSNRWQNRNTLSSRSNNNYDRNNNSRQGGEVHQKFQTRQRQEQHDQPRRTNSRWAPSAKAEPDCFGTICQCAIGQSSIYRQSKNSDHTIHNANLPNQKQATLLRNHGQFCGGFFHTAVSTEADNPFLCVGEGKYSKRRRSNVAVINVRVTSISSFLFYCLLLNHSFSTNPNKITNCFKFFSL
jgi:hypothetical protein